ncbi:hypothetical protein TL16_g06200 [Triparma laevis f. inornata]|nr:hypothetical protein TL16_g06200 [Triparma laevis f. inornata]
MVPQIDPQSFLQYPQYAPTPTVLSSSPTLETSLMEPCGGGYGNNSSGYNYPANVPTNLPANFPYAAVTVTQPGENVTVGRASPKSDNILPNGASVSVLYNGDPFNAVVVRYSCAHGQYEVKFGDGTSCFMPADTVTAIAGEKRGVTPSPETSPSDLGAGVGKKPPSRKRKPSLKKEEEGG